MLHIYNGSIKRAEPILPGAVEKWFTSDTYNSLGGKCRKWKMHSGVEVGLERKTEVNTKFCVLCVS